MLFLLWLSNLGNESNIITHWQRIFFPILTDVQMKRITLLIVSLVLKVEFKKYKTKTYVSQVFLSDWYYSFSKLCGKKYQICYVIN